MRDYLLRSLSPNVTLVILTCVAQVDTVTHFSSSSIEVKLSGAFLENPRLCWFSSEQWPWSSMNSNGRYNNSGRKIWGVNPTSKGLLNTSFDYPGLALTAVHVYKRFQWFWGKYQLLHFICSEKGHEHAKTIDQLRAFLASLLTPNLWARQFTWSLTVERESGVTDAAQF